jgi:hypothetical protein
MLIKNYGLYWSEAQVFWGYPGVEGTLFGVPSDNKRAEPTNFRSQAGVYVLYDNLAPVYVGETGIGNRRLFMRLHDHRADQLAGRWDSFSWFGIYPVNKVSRTVRVNTRLKPKIGDVRHHTEAILIAAMEPRLNLQRGKFGTAERYIQPRGQDDGPTESEMIGELYAHYIKNKKKGA